MTMRVLHAALAIAVAAGLAACSFTRPPVERATYDLAPARGAAPAAATKSVAVKVKPFRTAPPYDGREFLYRKSDGQLVADFYNGFAAGPGELVTTATAEWLKGSGLFGAVLEPGISADATYALEGAVLAVYGDLRDGKRPAAVLDLQVYLVRAGLDGRELVLDRRFSERVDVPDPSPEALAKGFNEALARILGRLERDLGALALKR
jgi:cholesterol transport system auxiliary component